MSIYKCFTPLTVLSRKQQLVFCRNLCHNYFVHISFQYLKIVWDRPCQASTMLESPLLRCAGQMMSPRLYFEEDLSPVNIFGYEKQLTFNFRGKLGQYSNVRVITLLNYFNFNIQIVNSHIQLGKIRIGPKFSLII